jgi:hypothetical protein
VVDGRAHAAHAGQRQQLVGLVQLLADRLLDLSISRG